ncbi:MAG TPA: TonB C-terminal domain-containing protein [Terriglobales bacterium]|nr:TonB C-terminal domain-containing protein [Terriglobales bacterium]
MSTTQIPPANPASSKPPGRPSESGDLYDARYWESAYREIVEAPALLIQLQDELSQARRREAFWISVVVHLIVVLLLYNSPKLAALMPRRAVVVASPESNQKDLTYLELPPDEQKVTKRPNTNIASDKDRVAMSHAPQIDRQELKKILDASRPGRPGATVPEAAQQPAAPAPAATQNATPQPSAPPPPPPNQNQVAKLQTPPAESAKAAFGNSNMSAGSAIEQAARAAAQNRGGFAGDGGNYGLGSGRKPTAAMGPLEVLTDTMGVDFGPYLQRVLHDVRQNWYNLIPESAKAPIMKKGKLTIEFAILKDGTVAGMKLVATSGDVALDRGAWGGITASNPFPPLPGEFGGQYLGLRFTFFYNPDARELQ